MKNAAFRRSFFLWLLTFCSLILLGSCGLKPARLNFVYPDQGADVKGILLVRVAVPLDYKSTLPRRGEVEFRFYIDDKLQEEAIVPESSDRVTWMWDTTEFPNGPHTITVVAVHYEVGRKGSPKKELQRLKRNVIVNN